MRRTAELPGAESAAIEATEHATPMPVGIRPGRLEPPGGRFGGEEVRQAWHVRAVDRRRPIECGGDARGVVGEQRSEELGDEPRMRESRGPGSGTAHASTRRSAIDRTGSAATVIVPPAGVPTTAASPRAHTSVRVGAAPGRWRTTSAASSGHATTSTSAANGGTRRPSSERFLRSRAPSSGASSRPSADWGSIGASSRRAAATSALLGRVSGCVGTRANTPLF